MNDLAVCVRVSASGGVRHVGVVGAGSGDGVEVDGVAEVLELAHETAGVGFGVAAGEPVGTEVLVGLVTVSMWNAATRMECATAIWARPGPRRRERRS